VNERFRKLLDVAGMELKLCRNPDVKCVVVEQFNRALNSKMHK
jgi:hypothetical protein